MKQFFERLQRGRIIKKMYQLSWMELWWKANAIGDWGAGEDAWFK